VLKYDKHCQVYLVKKDGEFMVLKAPSSSTDYEKEISVLKTLNEKNLTVLGFPKLFSCLRTNERQEILIEALGPDLDSCQQKIMQHQFLAYYYVLHLIDRVQTLHEANFVHGDITLQNVVVCKDDKHKLYLIDFGQSASIFNEQNIHMKDLMDH